MSVIRIRERWPGVLECGVFVTVDACSRPDKNGKAVYFSGGTGNVESAFVVAETMKPIAYSVQFKNNILEVFPANFVHKIKLATKLNSLKIKSKSRK